MVVLGPRFQGGEESRKPSSYMTERDIHTQGSTPRIGSFSNHEDGMGGCAAGAAVKGLNHDGEILQSSVGNQQILALEISCPVVTKAPSIRMLYVSEGGDSVDQHELCTSKGPSASPGTSHPHKAPRFHAPDACAHVGTRAGTRLDAQLLTQTRSQFPQP